MNIHRLQPIPNNVIQILDSKIDALKDADEGFQESYAKASTTEDYRMLLEAERRKFARAIKEVSDNIKDSMQRMNQNVSRCYEDIIQLPQPISLLEGMIDKYETDLEENNERIIELETIIDSLKLEIDELRTENVNPRRTTELTPGQINFRNSQKVNYICGRIKVAHTLTANAFNTLLALTVNNSESPPGSVNAWRRKAMDAYAIKIAPAGRAPNRFRDDEFLDVLRSIRMIVRNNASGANEIPDKADD